MFQGEHFSLYILWRVPCHYYPLLFWMFHCRVYHATVYPSKTFCFEPTHHTWYHATPQEYRFRCYYCHIWGGVLDSSDSLVHVSFWNHVGLSVTYALNLDRQSEHDKSCQHYLKLQSNVNINLKLQGNVNINLKLQGNVNIKLKAWSTLTSRQCHHDINKDCVIMTLTLEHDARAKKWCHGESLGYVYRRDRFPFKLDWDNTENTETLHINTHLSLFSYYTF